MEKIIEEFCTNGYDMNIFDTFPLNIKKLFIDKSFDVLNQKNGNLDLAAKILHHNNKIVKTEFTNIYTGESTLSPIDSLIRIGVTTLEMIDSSELKKYQSDFDKTISEFPEYKSGIRFPVLGGFAALGNPGSFHNMFVRQLRLKARKNVNSFMKEYVNTFENQVLRNTYKLELLPDRMMYRQKGQAAVAEAWHRDVMPSNLIEFDDEVYGGWINLDNKDQHFSFLPGSHLGIKQQNIRSGFDTLVSNIEEFILSTKEEKLTDGELTKICSYDDFRKITKQSLKYYRKVISKYSKDIVDISDMKKRQVFIKHKTKEYVKEINDIFKKISSYRQKVVIKPGHLIIFPQYILHEVVATPAKHNMRRLFTGWRLTTSNKSLRNYKNMFTNQSIIPLPGGMLPPLYAKNHITFFTGVPKIKNIDSKFNLKQESIKLCDKILSLYPTDKIKKICKKLRNEKGNDNLRKILVELVDEYNSESGIRNFETKQILDKNKMVTIGSFKLDDNNLTNIIKWSNEFKPNLLVTKKYKNGPVTYSIVPRHLKSLKELGLKLYPRYSDEEFTMYKPLPI